MANKIPNVVLNNGKNMPILGLGTWGSPQGEVAQAVKDAIDAGYRHFDCAHVYQNEHEVGEGVNAKIKEGVVTRDELFITSKLWNTCHRPDLVRGALETTLKNLSLSYLDLYLMHWPFAYAEGGDLFPKDEKDQIQFSDVDYLDAYKAMEKLVDEGLTKSIGISNFNSKQVERIVANARIQPVTNQVECHPYLNQNKLSAICRSKGIVLTAYSPLGSPARPWATAEDPQLLEDERLVAIAKKYSKTTAQTLIRYQIQKGNIVIPKSVNKSRIIANMDVFDFELNKDDIETLDKFDCNGRLVPMTGATGHKYHPFENDEY